MVNREVKTEADESAVVMEKLSLASGPVRHSNSSGSDEFEDAKETLPPKGKCHHYSAH